MRRYGAKKRSRADKNVGALMLVLMSDKSPEEKREILLRSHGQSEAQAFALVEEHCGG